MRFRSNFSKVIAVLDLLHQKALEQIFEKFDLRIELDLLRCCGSDCTWVGLLKKNFLSRPFSLSLSLSLSLSHIQVHNLCQKGQQGRRERWEAGVEYHFQEFNEPYAPS